MILSERGAIKAAICDGGYHIYPAAKIVAYIKDHLPNEEFRGDFDPKKTVKKIRSVKIEGDEHTKTVITEDINLLCSRLQKMDPEYNIESVFKKMSADLPKMAKLFFNIDGYKPVHTQVVEYFFEGYNTLYKDADWNAFNVDAAESKEYNVPIGIYFKRSQVAPGYPEYVVLHENVHQFTASSRMDNTTHYYVPWIDEGFADTFGYLMLYKTTKDLGLVSRTKYLAVEFDVLDSRKATYHYETAIASQFISNGGLPFTKAFLKVLSTELPNLDLSEIGRSVLKGKTSITATIDGFLGENKNEFRERLLRYQAEFSSQGNFDDDDLKILRFFSLTQAPATLNPPEYRAAIWLINELNNNTESHYLHSKFLPNNEQNEIIQIKTVGKKSWDKLPKGHNSFLVCRDDIPSDLQAPIDALGNYFFVVKKEYNGKTYYDVFGGGLPYRMSTGELRCCLECHPE